MIKRFISQHVQQSLTLFPAVLINGARQVGKSTLVSKLYHHKVIDEYVTLDDITVLTSCRNDPVGFVSQFQGSVAIDEIQRCPDLLLAIKKEIDQNRKPGKFLLTGSANILSYPGIPESLAGRMDIITLEGLSLAEINQHSYASCFLEDVFSGLDSNDLAQKWSKDLSNKAFPYKNHFIHSVFYGSFPEVALKKDTYFLNRWLSSYLLSYIERDVRDLNRLLDIVNFSKVFKLIGLQTGQLSHIQNIAVEAGIDQRSVSRYLEILELTFQVSILQPYYSNLRKRLIKTPKIYLNDSGYASFFAGIRDPEQLQNHPHFGHILETWLFGELRKLIYLTMNTSIFFYRTHQGKEIDFILTQADKVVAIECKATESIQSQHLSGLRDLQSENPDVLGIIFYFGDKVIKLQSNIIALPFSILS